MYEGSFAAGLVALSQWFQEIAIDELRRLRGDDTLTITHVFYALMLAVHVRSPSQMAGRLEISKQACSRFIQKMRSQGFAHRLVHSEDCRLSVFDLSAEGLALLTDSVVAVNQVYLRLDNLLGGNQLAQGLDAIDRLCVASGIASPANAMTFESCVSSKTGATPSRLVYLLIPLSVIERRRILTLVGQQHFRNLLPGVGQILGLVCNGRRRLADLALLLGISKQAVGACAVKLEELGYAFRAADLTDRRHIILDATHRGHALIGESRDHVRSVDQMMRCMVSDADYHALDAMLGSLYRQPSTFMRPLHRAGQRMVSREQQLTTFTDALYIPRIRETPQDHGHIASESAYNLEHLAVREMTQFQNSLSTDLIVETLQYFSRILESDWRRLNVRQKLYTLGVIDDDRRLSMCTELQMILNTHNVNSVVLKSRIIGVKTIADVVNYLLVLAGQSRAATTREAWVAELRGLQHTALGNNVTYNTPT